MIRTKKMNKMLAALFAASLFFAPLTLTSCDHSPEDEEETTATTDTSTTETSDTSTTEYTKTYSASELFTDKDGTTAYDGSMINWSAVGIPASKLSELGITSNNLTKVVVKASQAADYMQLRLSTFKWTNLGEITYSGISNTWTEEDTSLTPTTVYWACEDGTISIVPTSAQTSTMLEEGLAFVRYGFTVSSIELTYTK